MLKDIKNLTEQEKKEIKYYKALDFRLKEGKNILKFHNFKNKKEFIDNIFNHNLKNKNVYLITYNDLNDNNNILVNKDNLIYTLKHYNVFKNNNKKQLISNLKNFYMLRDKCKSNLKHIIYLQKYFKQTIEKIKQKHGPAYNNLNVSNNITEFYSLEHIQNIDRKYFISFKDHDNFIYTFDVRSLKYLFNKYVFDNPYNRLKFPQYIIDSVNNWTLDINLNNNTLSNKISLKKHDIKRRVTDLFQIMDSLDQYTNVKWFNDLNINQLKDYYRSLEDIWNYRAQLDIQKKWEIIQDSELFTLSVMKFYKLRNLQDIQNIILDNIEKLITKGINRQNRVLGCLYVLSSFAEISQEAHNELAWLISI